MKHFYILFFVSILLIGCEKSEDAKSSQMILVDRILETFGGYSGMNYFQYDTAGNITRMSHRNLAPGATDSFYTVIGRNYGKVTGMSLGLRLDSIPMEFFIHHDPATGLMDYFIKKHRARKDSFRVFVTLPLITVEGYYIDTATLQVTKGGTNKYQFTNGKLTDLKIYASNGTTLLSHEVFSYDSKISPFKLSLEETVILLNRFGYLFMSAGNNITGVNDTSVSGSITQRAMTYTYNTDSLPSVAVMTSTGVTTNRQFEYFYK